MVTDFNDSKAPVSERTIVDHSHLKIEGGMDWKKPRGYLHVPHLKFAVQVLSKTFTCQHLFSVPSYSWQMICLQYLRALSLSWRTLPVCTYGEDDTFSSSHWRKSWATYGEDHTKDGRQVDKSVHPNIIYTQYAGFIN